MKHLLIFFLVMLGLLAGVNAIDYNNITFTNQEFYNGAVTATKTIQINSTHIAVVFIKSASTTLSMKTCLLNGTSCSSDTDLATSVVSMDAFLNTQTNSTIIIPYGQTTKGGLFIRNFDGSSNATGVNFNGATSTNYVSAVQINSTDFGIAFQDTADTNDATFIVCKLDGSSCGSELNVDTGSTSYQKLIKLSNGNLIFASAYSTTFAYTWVISSPYTTAGSATAFNTGTTSYIDMIEGSDNKLKIVFRDEADSNKGKFISCNLGGTGCGSEVTVYNSRADYNNILENNNKLFYAFNDGSSGALKSINFNLTGGNISSSSLFDTSTGEYVDQIFLTSNQLLMSYGASSKGRFAISEAFTTASTITINTPIATYYNTTSITLNVTTSLNTNLTYSLNGASNISLGTDINSSVINITAVEGQNNLTVYSNYSGEITSSSVTFTVDTTLPVINNNILSEYNYYTNNNLNSSCTDTNLVSCNISMNSQNKLLNQSFNFTTNGNQTYNITAIDLAGNTVTESGVTLVNPYQTFRFYDYLRLTNINDFYIDGVLYSSNYTFKTYNYGLGSWDFNFSKEGYVNQTFNFTLNDTSNYNQTNNVTAVTITIKAYDIDTLVQIPFNLTLNGGVIAQYYNQVNFSDYYNNTPQGDVNALIASIGYSSANYNINIGAYSALTLTAYLIPLNDSDLFQFTVLSQDTGAALASVLIEIQELINTSYITASSKLTGDNGKTYFYLDSNKEYKVIFSKDEYVTATAFTIPTVTTYTVKLTGDSTTFNYVNEISYSFKPSEYLLQNNETYNFIGFISGNSLTSSNFSIVLNNGTTIYTNSNVNPTGTTYNYSYSIPNVANFTQMTMTINYIIDGELFTVSKDYKVITLNEDSFIKTMQNFGESNTEESNLWKWFIVMIATVLVLISGVFLGTAVPLLIIPLWVFFSFAGWVDFTFTAVISVVALIMFLGGRR